MADQRFRLDHRRHHVANQRFDIFFDRLVGPDGTAIDDFLTVRPRVLVGPLKIGGIVVLPVLDGKVGLMQGYRHQFDQIIWQAPSGFVEPNEQPADTARRELEEEAALTCGPYDIVSLGTLMPDAGLIEARVALFAARNCAPSTEAATAEPGSGLMKWMSLSEAEKIAHDDPNVGASTVVAIVRYTRLAARPR
ncbi:MAG: NUDIX hydrolase [Alphaproteobacteria bacterium]|nr:NUDIX hydrolase [Alphaproteobacteria bacterium]